MPAARLWEIEDGSVELGAIDAAADDVARLLVWSSRSSYGNDFFVVPPPTGRHRAQGPGEAWHTAGAWARPARMSEFRCKRVSRRSYSSTRSSASAAACSGWKPACFSADAQACRRLV
jgi:hypothetical protein